MSKCHEQDGKYYTATGRDWKTSYYTCRHCKHWVLPEDMSADCPARKETMETIKYKGEEFDAVSQQEFYDKDFAYGSIDQGWRAIWIRPKKKFDPSNLEPGVYRIWFKSHATVVAAIGCHPSGDRWFAPATWNFGSCDKWSNVERVELIEKA